MSTNTPFRESSYTDLYQRVEKLERDAKTSRVRELAWKGWATLGHLLCYALVLGALFLAVRYTVFHGSAWGINGHRNAEREALRWGKTRWPTLTSANVYCTASHQGTGGDAWDEDECRVTVPDTSPSVVWLVVCDDDDPNANDGCIVSRARIDLPKNEDEDKGPDDAGTHPDATRSVPPR